MSQLSPSPLQVPVGIKIETRIFKVSSTAKVGRATTQAPKGQVYLTPEGGSPYQADWPVRLHGETYRMVCVGPQN